MRFRKFHGIGNDFVMIEDPTGEHGPAGSLDPALVASICDRRTGVGADGVIRVLDAASDSAVSAAGARLGMDYYNADGQPAEMCGNGIRCLAILAFDNGWIGDEETAVLTGAGVKTVKVHPDRRVTVDMGRPGLNREDVPMAGTGSAMDVGVVLPGGANIIGTGVSMGNPHFVVFCEHNNLTPDDATVHGLGPQLETHPAFPKKANIEFVTLNSPTRVSTRVWERGVGETQACGTGACAVAVACAQAGLTPRRLTVELPGGDLDIHWSRDGQVEMTGPAVEVFSGELHFSSTGKVQL